MKNGHRPVPIPRPSRLNRFLMQYRLHIDSGPCWRWVNDYGYRWRLFWGQWYGCEVLGYTRLGRDRWYVRAFGYTYWHCDPVRRYFA